jgi:hypothetical protein
MSFIYTCKSLLDDFLGDSLNVFMTSSTISIYHTQWKNKGAYMTNHNKSMKLK